jgi:hypothetical protein
MRKLGLFIYLGCLLFTVAKTLISVVRAGKAVPSIGGRNGWYYLIFRDEYGRYYFVTDFSGQGERGSKPLYELVKEIRYRIFFYKSGRVLDNSDVMVSLYYSWFGSNCKFVLFEELPLEDYSKKLIRELYHEVLENNQ